MPYQGGGPWGGQRPAGGGGPADLEEILRRGQDRVRRVLPGSFGGGRGILLAALALVVFWLLTGLYRVQPDEQGVELLFGSWTGPRPNLVSTTGSRHRSARSSRRALRASTASTSVSAPPARRGADRHRAMCRGKASC